MRRASGVGLLGSLEPGISQVRTSERDLRTARHCKSQLAGSCLRLAVPPHGVGQSRVVSPSPQRYLAEGRKQQVEPQTLERAFAAVTRIRASDPRITPVLTLRHLARETGVEFRFLRGVISRRAHRPYRSYTLKKRIPGRSRRRLICAPTLSLKQVQQWIVEHILQFTEPHLASYAFHPDSSPVRAAEQHPHTQWLLKVDIEDFFHSVSEGAVAEVFLVLGFQSLLAFELARLCTIEGKRLNSLPSALRWTAIPLYQNAYEGFLPQGAPTSPMLANLAFKPVDERLEQLARKHGLRYTRYADDLAFSTAGVSSYQAMARVRREVYRILNEGGFRPNERKGVIRGPGTRRIILGMLVDGKRPALQRSYKDLIRLHLYYLKSKDHGPAVHASQKKRSVSSMYHHVRGLIAWAKCIDQPFGDAALKEFNSVTWPPIQRRSFPSA